jgi:hypothetical protein
MRIPPRESTACASHFAEAHHHEGDAPQPVGPPEQRLDGVARLVSMVFEPLQADTMTRQQALKRNAHNVLNREITLA